MWSKKKHKKEEILSGQFSLLNESRTERERWCVWWERLRKLFHLMVRSVAQSSSQVTACRMHLMFAHHFYFLQSFSLLTSQSQLLLLMFPVMLDRKMQVFNNINSVFYQQQWCYPKDNFNFFLPRENTNDFLKIYK